MDASAKNYPSMYSYDKMSPSEDVTQIQNRDTIKIRKVLRHKEWQNWCSLKEKGKDVCLYSEFTQANVWMRRHHGLSCAEMLNGETH